MVGNPRGADRHSYVLFIWPDHGPVTQKRIDMRLVAAARDKVVPSQALDAEVNEVIRQIKSDPQFTGVDASRNRATLREMLRFMGAAAMLPGMVYYCPGTIPGGRDGDPEKIRELTAKWEKLLQDERTRLEQEKRAAVNAAVDAQKQQDVAELRLRERESQQSRLRVDELERQRGALQEQIAAATQQATYAQRGDQAHNQQLNERIGTLESEVKQLTTRNETLEQQAEQQRASMRKQALEVTNLRDEKKRLVEELARAKQTVSRAAESAEAPGRVSVTRL